MGSTFSTQVQCPLRVALLWGSRPKLWLPEGLHASLLIGSDAARALTAQPGSATKQRTFDFGKSTGQKFLRKSYDF
jgi:hypothetical protein